MVEDCRDRRAATHMMEDETAVQIMRDIIETHLQIQGRSQSFVRRMSERHKLLMNTLPPSLRRHVQAAFIRYTRLRNRQLRQYILLRQQQQQDDDDDARSTCSDCSDVQ